MAVINPHTTRATGTVLTAAIYNADHQNHITNANSLNVETVAGTAAIIVNAANIALLLSKPTMQSFSGNGTWTKPTGCKRIIVEAVGGGGGSGGVGGSGLGNWGSTGGGGSGFYGLTSPINVTAVANGAVVIGAAGVAGAAAAGAGGNGGSTTITIGATTYTWPGGDASPGATASSSAHLPSSNGGFASIGTNVIGSSNQGQMGWSSETDTDAFGGHGAASPFGVGGARSVISTTGGVAGTAAAANTGAGGGGACTGNQAINRAGGAGGTGFMRVWEYY